MPDNRDSHTQGLLPVQQLSAQWSRASRHALKSSVNLMGSAVEANQALIAAFGGPTSTDENGMAAAPIAETEYQAPDWEFERSVDAYDELDVGETVSFSKRVSDEDVRTFARVSGDTNRLHLDERFAERTRFGGRIVHGTLLSGLISAALARLPGLTIYLSQELAFRRPVEIGTELTAVCEIVEDLGDGRYRLVTTVSDEAGETVLDGEAVVLIEELPATADDG